MPAHKGWRRGKCSEQEGSDQDQASKKATTLEREDLIVRSKREAIKEEHEGGG